MLNTIGPVWDGNEVWLITAGGAMFAAFPGVVRDDVLGLYLPLLAILFGMILRICAIEWRGKINDPRWRRWADIGIASAPGCRQCCGASRSRSCCAGCRWTPTSRSHPAIGECSAPTPCSAGWPPRRCSLFHGAVFMALKTAGEVHEDASGSAGCCRCPVIVVAGGFGLWTQLAYGKPVDLARRSAVAVVALLVAVACWCARRTPRRLGLRIDA